VLHRDGVGFDLDASRIAYLRYLRRERQQSPRSKADADYQRAKTEPVRMRIAEKQRTTIPLYAIAVTDQIVGVLLTHLGSMPAIIGGRDLQLRRPVEQCVFDTRVAISEAASKLADQRGEPPEDDAA
jgi:hypothetical protein